MKFKFKQKVCILLILVLSVVGMYGCSDMPFNGHIEFHNISLTIPEKFVRDSTQSNDDLWLFEYDSYKEYIIINRKDIVGDSAKTLDEYADYLTKDQGAGCERTTFLKNDALLSTYEQQGELWQELLFAYKGSFYAVALRGGTEDEFKAILDTVSLKA